MIEIASDNHLFELEKLSKATVKSSIRWGSLVDIGTFKEQVLSGSITTDETCQWCCFHAGHYYVGDYVYWDKTEEDGNDTIEFKNKSEWANMVYWYGK